MESLEDRKARYLKISNVLCFVLSSFPSCLGKRSKSSSMCSRLKLENTVKAETIKVCLGYLLRGWHGCQKPCLIFPATAIHAFYITLNEVNANISMPLFAVQAYDQYIKDAGPHHTRQRRGKDA